MPKAVDRELKALLNSETFGSLKELKKRGEKSSGYAGLWPWLGSWLSLGEGFGKRKTTGGGQKKHENQICLGNKRWIVSGCWCGSKCHTGRKEVNPWLNLYLLPPGPLWKTYVQQLTPPKNQNQRKILELSTCSLRRGWEQNMWQRLVMLLRKVFKNHDEWWVSCKNLKYLSQ